MECDDLNYINKVIFSFFDPMLKNDEKEEEKQMDINTYGTKCQMCTHSSVCALKEKMADVTADISEYAHKSVKVFLGEPDGVSMDIRCKHFRRI